MKTKCIAVLVSAMLMLHACADTPGTHKDAGEVTAPQLTAGKKLFVDNCALCHSVKKDKMGPALEGSLARWDNDTARLTAFIRNSPEFIKSGDPYARELYDKWNKATMTPFPHLTDEEVLQIIDYVENTGG